MEKQTLRLKEKALLKDIKATESPLETIHNQNNDRTEFSFHNDKLGLIPTTSSDTDLAKEIKELRDLKDYKDFKEGVNSTNELDIENLLLSKKRFSEISFSNSNSNNAVYNNNRFGVCHNDPHIGNMGNILNVKNLTKQSLLTTKTSSHFSAVNSEGTKKSERKTRSEKTANTAKTNKSVLTNNTVNTTGNINCNDNLTQNSKSRNTWSFEEDNTLKFLIEDFQSNTSEVINWKKIEEKMKILYLEGKVPNLRNGKQCRERWINHLETEVNKRTWSPQEEEILFAKAKEHGNRWSEIAKHLNKRTDNCIKNHYYSSLRKNIRRLLKHLSGRNKGKGENADSYIDYEQVNSELVYKMLKLFDITYLDLNELSLKFIVLTMVEYEVNSADDINNMSHLLREYYNSKKEQLMGKNDMDSENLNDTYESTKKPNSIIVYDNKNMVGDSSYQTESMTASKFNTADFQNTQTNSFCNINTTDAYYPDNSVTQKNFVYESDNTNNNSNNNSNTGNILNAVNTNILNSLSNTDTTKILGYSKERERSLLKEKESNQNNTPNQSLQTNNLNLNANPQFNPIFNHNPQTNTSFNLKDLQLVSLLNMSQKESGGFDDTQLQFNIPPLVNSTSFNSYGNNMITNLFTNNIQEDNNNNSNINNTNTINKSNMNSKKNTNEFIFKEFNEQSDDRLRTKASYFFYNLYNNEAKESVKEGGNNTTLDGTDSSHHNILNSNSNINPNSSVTSNPSLSQNVLKSRNILESIKKDIKLSKSKVKLDLENKEKKKDYYSNIVNMAQANAGKKPTVSIDKATLSNPESGKEEGRNISTKGSNTGLVEVKISDRKNSENIGMNTEMMKEKESQKKFSVPQNSNNSFNIKALKESLKLNDSKSFTDELNHLNSNNVNYSAIEALNKKILNSVQPNNIKAVEESIKENKIQQQQICKNSQSIPMLDPIKANQISFPKPKPTPLDFFNEFCEAYSRTPSLLVNNLKFNASRNPSQTFQAVSNNKLFNNSILSRNISNNNMTTPGIIPISINPGNQMSNNSLGTIGIPVLIQPSSLNRNTSTMTINSNNNALNNYNLEYMLGGFTNQFSNNSLRNSRTFMKSDTAASETAKTLTQNSFIKSNPDFKFNTSTTFGMFNMGDDLGNSKNTNGRDEEFAKPGMKSGSVIKGKDSDFKPVKQE